MNETLKKVLSLEHYNRQNQQIEWKAELPLIESWSIREIIVENCCAETLIKDITHINFPYLHTLYLWRDKVQSIETINFINLPSLHTLWLSYNKIISISSFSKGKFPLLKDLRIHGNKIGNKQRFAFMNLDAMKELSLETVQTQERNGYDTRWIMKSNLPLLESLWILSEKRVKNTAIEDMLTKKFKKTVVRSF